MSKKRNKKSFNLDYLGNAGKVGAKNLD